ncbi:hypothetical protein AFIC_000918 [[Pseudomonas] carboxydohydrogena]|uniref:Uncharacterized protein n=1 Tax=Afipia carboxydohydrogena TaxID=290 RepID=A0ABY8BR06_AFICR|nr:hypothetical protein AFIC_000918 [[Pseudomonas] carboxydohydrogena]
MCRSKITVWRRGGYGRHDLNNFGDGFTQEEMIVSNLIDLAHAADQLENPPHLRLGDARIACDIAYARRPEAHFAANIMGDLAPNHLIGRRQPHLMARQANPCAIERHLLVAREALQQGDKDWRRKSRLELQPQALKPHSGEVRMVRVKSRECGVDRILQAKPCRRCDHILRFRSWQT